MKPQAALRGLRIVVTRPARQAALLAQLIESHGAQVILFPVIDIRDVEDTSVLNAVIDRLDSYDLAIFVSPNAVDKGFEAIRARRTVPPALRFAAIGRGSAGALRKLGVGGVMAPDAGADSESLLRVPELNEIGGQRIVIFRGVGGRELLRDTLEARGAHVDYAECYHRVKPGADMSPIRHALAGGDIDALVFTSSEGLRNFCELLGAAETDTLARVPIFVPHPRIGETARELRMAHVTVTPGGDEGIVGGMIEHFATAS
jgi:uroporphyrinogen-III synthase